MLCRCAKGNIALLFTHGWILIQLFFFLIAKWSFPPLLHCRSISHTSTWETAVDSTPVGVKKPLLTVADNNAALVPPHSLTLSPHRSSSSLLHRACTFLRLGLIAEATAKGCCHPPLPAEIWVLQLPSQQTQVLCMDHWAILTQGNRFGTWLQWQLSTAMHNLSQR